MANLKRMILEEEATAILRAGRYGVLSTASAEGEPYGVPVNYCFDERENCIFFHCSKTGKKIDNMMANDRVSFIVIGYEQVVPERFITHYESVLATGRVEMVRDEQEKRDKLLQLCEKFSPGAVERREDVITKYLPAVAIFKILMDSVTGKRNNDD
jgi:uncharacterized protein